MRLELADGALEGVDRLIGKRLRERRRMLGLTQQDLGSRLGVTFQQVQKYESGANRLSCARLFQIAAILEAPVSELLGLTETSTTYDDHSAASEDFITLWDNFSSIKTAARRRAILFYCLSVENGEDPDMIYSGALFHLERFKRQNK